MWCVAVCGLETIEILVNVVEAKAQWGTIAPREKKPIYFIYTYITRSDVSHPQ